MVCHCELAQYRHCLSAEESSDFAQSRNFKRSASVFTLTATVKVGKEAARSTYKEVEKRVHQNRKTSLPVFRKHCSSLVIFCLPAAWKYLACQLSVVFIEKCSILRILASQEDGCLTVEGRQL